MPDPPRVLSLRRYPVKSMLGAPVSLLDIDERGCVGDRLWSVRTATGKIASGKNTRRFAAVSGLLDLRAEQRDGRVVITFPDGSVCHADASNAADRLTHHLGQATTLAKETSVSHFDDGPISLIGSASIAALAYEQGRPVDPGRFRANIYLDTAEAFAEDTWIGRQLHIGTAVLRVEIASPRCVMVNMKTADLPAQPGNLAAIGRLNGACLGVIATVVRPGRINAGDLVTIR